MSLPSAQVDHSALRTNQAFIILLSISAFVLDLPWLALSVGVLMLLGTLVGVPAFGLIYRYVFKPLGWLAPDVIADHPQPHRFAQGFGAVVMLIASRLLLVGLSFPGWTLVWLVIALASLNLFAGFCVGCALYYWMARLGVPGFVRSSHPGEAQ